MATGYRPRDGELQSHLSRRPIRSLALAMVLGGSIACDGARASIPDDILPVGFVARSDTPYVRGTIVSREIHELAIRIRVKDLAGSDARVTEALISVGPNTTLRWRDGAQASFTDLRVGGRVVVWTTTPELESAPPHVTGSAILLERR